MSASSSDSKEDADDALGAARSLLFNDQHRAMNNQAQLEQEILDPNMQEMEVLSKTRRKRLNQRVSSGIGFGASQGESLTKTEVETKLLASQVREDGVVLIPGVLTKETAASLRECILNEIEVMRDAIRRDPSLSFSLFYVPAEIHFSTPRGYVLLPFRDSHSVLRETGTSPIVTAARELLAPGTPLAGLFGETCDGADSQLYDFCALRTEPGAARQVVHSDTPHQEIPGLFCAFVALQDVTMEMGGTMFIPKTHIQNTERKKFDSGNSNEMLRAAKPKYTMLKAGDAVFFDMRTLHAGLANLQDGGAQRILLAITFRNLKAKEALGHRPNLRPGYVGQFTLGTFQEELASKYPFSAIGDGLS